MSPRGRPRQEPARNRVVGPSRAIVNDSQTFLSGCEPADPDIRCSLCLRRHRLLPVREGGGTDMGTACRSGGGEPLFYIPADAGDIEYR